MTGKLKSEVRATCISVPEQVAAIRRTFARAEKWLDYAEKNDRDVALALVLSVDCKGGGEIPEGNTIVTLMGAPDVLAYFVGRYLVPGILRLQAEEGEDDAD